MILKEFAKVLQQNYSQISPSEILANWIKNILSHPPITNVEKVIHAELTILYNQDGTFAIVGISKSGQKLLETLYRFIESYENQAFSRWVHNNKPNDFKQDKQL